MPQPDASDRLLDLIFEALDTAMDTLSHKQPLIPFALLLTNEGIIKQRYLAEDTQAALHKAQQALHKAAVTTRAYVLVYDGYVMLDADETDAVMIEAGEQGKAHGLRFARRYRPPLAAMPLMPIGDLAYLGRAEQYLSIDDSE